MSQDTLKSKNTEKILLAVADGMSKVEDPSRRAALAQQIFGRGAQGLIPILAQGKQGRRGRARRGAAVRGLSPAARQTIEGHGRRATQSEPGDGRAQNRVHHRGTPLPGEGRRPAAEVHRADARPGRAPAGSSPTRSRRGSRSSKTVVDDVVSAFGGLKTTLLILGGLWATSKVVSFGNALKRLAGMAKGPVAKGLEEQASGGILSGLRAGVARGLAIGGIGTTLSAGIGNAIGGGTGDAIKKIGTDASIGAGIGAIFGPEGAVGGALIGGLVGSLHHFVVSDVVKEGQAFADKFTAPLGPAVTKQFHGALAKAQEKTTDTQQLQKFRQQDGDAPGIGSRRSGRRRPAGPERAGSPKAVLHPGANGG